MEAIKKIELNKIVKVILVAVLGTLLLTISAKIKIPFYPVPMTMQTFVVLFLGITLGPKIGLLTISLYLFEGIFIFADIVIRMVPTTVSSVSLTILSIFEVLLIASIFITIQLFLMKSSFLLS